MSKDKKVENKVEDRPGSLASVSSSSSTNAASATTISCSITNTQFCVTPLSEVRDSSATGASSVAGTLPMTIDPMRTKTQDYYDGNGNIVCTATMTLPPAHIFTGPDREEYIFHMPGEDISHLLGSSDSEGEEDLSS